MHGRDGDPAGVVVRLLEPLTSFRAALESVVEEFFSYLNVEDGKAVACRLARIDQRPDVAPAGKGARESVR